MIFDPATTEEKPKYLWDVAAGRNGDVYVAAGAPAVVYRVPAGGGKAAVFFKTADQHIRCLTMAPDGMLWAGSDGAGVVYRIDTKTPGAKPFAVYAAPRREITSLALDDAGNVYISNGQGVMAFDPNGNNILRIPTGTGATNNTFAGRDDKLLFITGPVDSVTGIKMKNVKGAPNW